MFVSSMKVSAENATNALSFAAAQGHAQAVAEFQLAKKWRHVSGDFL
jgi:RNA polymerase sigma-70 factor (ECF subfamily)